MLYQTGNKAKGSPREGIEVATEYTLVSGDSHILERHDMWINALGSKFGDEIPHPVGEFRGEKGHFYYTGRQIVRLGDADKEHRDSGLSAAGFEPEARLKFQKEAKVSAEVLYPTFMLIVMQSKHYRALNACAEVYNDWMREFFSHDRKRLLGIASIPTVDPQWAIQELDRSAKNGFKGVTINVRPPMGIPPYREAVWDPFFARCVELNMPITLHTLTGWVPDFFHPQSPEEASEAPRMALETFEEIKGTLAADFIFGGVLDRHPELKLVISEFEFSWLPNFMWRIDMLATQMASRVKLPKLKRAKPSDYIRSNTWYGWVDDPYGHHGLEVIGTDRLMWGSDFPHVRSMALNAQSDVAKLLNKLPRAEQEKIVHTNSAALYLN